MGEDLQNYPTTAFGLPDLSRQQQQQMAGLAAEQEQTRMASDAERNRALSPFEKHHAEILQRLLFSNEDPAAVARDHFTRNPARLNRPGVAPEQNPGYTQGQPPPQSLSVPASSGGPPPGPAQVVQVPVPPQGGLSVPPQQAPMQGGSGALMPSRGLSNPVSSTSSPGPQSFDRNGPQTKGDLDALMGIVHSGVFGAQERERTTKESNDLRMKLLERQESGKTERQAVTEGGKGARQDKSLGVKQSQFDEHQKYLYAALDQAHRDKMAALRKDLQIAADKASKANGKVDPAFSKELSDLRTRINSVTNDRAKLLSKKSDVLTNQSEMDSLQKEADALAAEKKDLQGKFDEIAARVNKTSTVSGGGETSTKRVKVEIDGKRGTVDESQFDPKTMKRLE